MLIGSVIIALGWIPFSIRGNVSVAPCISLRRVSVDTAWRWTNCICLPDKTFKAYYLQRRSIR
jgi:hypothetical protein